MKISPARVPASRSSSIRQKLRRAIAELGWLVEPEVVDQVVGQFASIMASMQDGLVEDVIHDIEASCEQMRSSSDPAELLAAAELTDIIHYLRDRYMPEIEE